MLPKPYKHYENMKQFLNKYLAAFSMLCILLHFALISNAQIKTTSQRVELPDSTVEKKLVELALQNPAFEVANHQDKINEYRLKAEKNSWMNLLTLSANYNDQTFAKNTNNSQYVYPKFFTGINIPLGTIFSKTAVKSAKEQIEIGKNSREISERAAKAEILGRYKSYKTLGTLILQQQQVVDDYKAGLIQAEKKFSDAEITIEAYNSSSRNYNEELAKLMNLKLQQDLTKLDIEKIIGVSLESVLF